MTKQEFIEADPLRIICCGRPLNKVADPLQLHCCGYPLEGGKPEQRDMLVEQSPSARHWARTQPWSSLAVSLVLLYSWEMDFVEGKRHQAFVFELVHLIMYS